MFNSALTIRVAKQGDPCALELFARLSPRRRPASGPALLAERDGMPVAAIGLTSGAVIADPFDATRETLRALRFTRYRILRQGGQTGAARGLLRRAGLGPQSQAAAGTDGCP